MAAIQLADGEQVQSGRKQPDPGGAGHRVQVEVGQRNAGEDQLGGQPDEQRRAEYQVALLADAGHDFRVGQADA